MIPNIQPIPSWQPSGWSPNSLSPTAQQLSADVEAAFEEMRLALVPGFLYIAERNLTLTELQNLATSPQIVIPAPGPQLAIAPLYYVSVFEIGATPFTTAGTIFFRYDGWSAKIISDADSPAAQNANRRAVLTYQALGNDFQTLAPGTPPVNTAVRIHSSIDWTGAADVLRAYVRISYALLSVPTSY